MISGCFIQEKSFEMSLMGMREKRCALIGVVGRYGFSG